ncbi:ThiF family adenylyltransferase [Fluviicola sp. SGL-29]|nr:ThiF family adenylyltransferase [Fluviicola sp. SGL-29]
MKKWKIKFKEGLFKELNNYLFSNSPEENGCFLLGDSKDKIIFITDIIYPENEEWIQRGEDMCVPSPSYVIHSSVIADKHSSSLIFVHSHPKEHHPSSFSWIDEISNKKMFENLGEVHKEPLGSFVFSRKGIHGVVFNSGIEESIDNFSIYGERINIIPDSESDLNTLDKVEFDRQIRFMGKEVNILSNLNIAIVGLGGIGSPIAVMLAKMGAKKMTFFDHDKVEKHNLPRILGANEKSIGSYKVEVVKDFISSFNSVDIKINFYGINSDSNLSEFDVIFGCVDNHTTRDIINQQSLIFNIPYIDMACSIPMDNKKKVCQAVIAVSTVLNGKPCLWCNGTLDAMAIMEESLSDEEKKQRESDGYIQHVHKAPSVITLTSAVASFGINRLLNLINILPGEYPDKMMFDFNSSMYFEPQVEIKEKCDCSKRKVFKQKLS